MELQHNICLSGSLQASWASSMWWRINGSSSREPQAAITCDGPLAVGADVLRRGGGPNGG